MSTIQEVLALLLILFITQTSSAVVTFDWATIGNPGNTGELSGWGAGGEGPDAIVGGVDYIYQISKYEVTAGQYTEFLNAVAASDPYGLYNTLMWSSKYGCKIERSGADGSYTYSVASDRENRPVNYVSYFDAMRFVNWLDNGQGSGDTESGVYTISDGLSEVRNPNATYFIPSEDEWYKAAYYNPTTSTYFDYPTGSNSNPVNYVWNPDPGNNANFYQSRYTIGSPYYTTSVGEFENSSSPYGTFDQGGNVFEFNEAILNGWARGIRGGSFGYYPEGLHAANRYQYFVGNEEDGAGFRVASVPDPVSGDFDNDGDVDGADFLAWQCNPSLGSLADWRANYSMGPLIAVASVPEPSAVVLLCSGPLLMVTRRRAG